MEINYRVLRAGGYGNTLAVRGVSPQAVAKLVNSIDITGLRSMGNLCARQRFLPATKAGYDEYLTEFGPSYVRTNDAGLTYYILVLDIFDGNHRFHATSQLIKQGKLTAKDIYFQTAVYNEFLPDVVAELTGRLLNEYVRFLLFTLV